MEIIIAPSLNKIPKKERIKTPFFYAINKLKKDYKFFRIHKVNTNNIFENTNYSCVSKFNKIVFKNNNFYNVSTRYKISNKIDTKLKKIHYRVRSLDFYYFFFLGYYELIDNQNNYIRFLKEYLHFYFEYIKQVINFFNSDRFKNNFVKNNTSYKLKYIKNNLISNRSYIVIPSLLKCPDIGKFVVNKSYYYFLNKKQSKNILKDYLNFNNKKIKECFKNENLDNFFEIKNTNSDDVINSVNKNSIINFTNEYGNSSKIFKKNKKLYDIESPFDQECIDHYYTLFEEKFTLKNLFEKALKELIKDGYSF